MSIGWRELIARPDDDSGPMNVQSARLYRNPNGGKRVDAYPANGPPGSDFEVLKMHLLDEGLRERVVLGYDEGLLSSAFPNHYVARAVVRAANDWTLDRWLSHDSRLYGMILVSTALPEEAALEIRRTGTSDRMVAVALGANGLGRPFGHPVYHPIYRAASEMGLPVVIQVGCDSATDLFTRPVAGGMPTTYAEYHALAFQSLMAHASSLIVQGVFDLFPGLRVLLVGGGAAWIPSYLWRLNYWYKMLRHEAPWLRQLPSDYFVQHFRLSTYGLETPQQPEHLVQALATLHGVEQLLMYSSCYPNSDSEAPEVVAHRLPKAWHRAIFHDNAASFFRWPSVQEPRRAAEPTVPSLQPSALRDHVSRTELELGFTP